MARQHKHSRRPNVVTITNPVPGGSAYTSRRMAELLVWRGRAEWNGDSIRLVDRAAVSSRDLRLIKLVLENANENWIARQRGGAIFWNGPDHNPLAHHRPGEVRS